MPILEDIRVTEGAIWNRLLQTGSKRLSLETARFLLRLEFSQEDKFRMQDLAAKARDGSLTPVEQEVVRNFEHVGNLLALMKSKARQRLKKASHANGSGR